MLLFTSILTEYGGCSNSKFNSSEYVFNCLQNHHGMVLENPRLVLHLSLFFFFTSSYFLFVWVTSPFQVIELLEKRHDYFSYMSSFFSSIYHWKGRARCVCFQKNLELIYITLNNHVCLPSCLSDMPVCTPNVCPLNNETLIFVFPDLLIVA